MRRPLAPLIPIHAPARIPPIVPLQNQNQKHQIPLKPQTCALLMRSKKLAVKIPGIFLAVSATFVTEMFVRYNWGDKFCYIFPFWI